MAHPKKSKAPAPQSDELMDDVRDSARAGQHAAAEALRKFTRAVDEAIPEAVHPLRAKIIDAAIDLAEGLSDAQHQFNKKLIRTADRALSHSEGPRQ